MKFTLTIDTDNAAFGDSDEERANEVARILRELASAHEQAGDTLAYYALRDFNGNTVGVWAEEG